MNCNIKTELIKLGYNLANIGTIYLIESIDIICNSEDYIKKMLNLENNVYSQVAKNHNSSVKTVKSDIVKATNNMDKIRSFQNNNLTELKFTPKSVIYYIVENIKNV